MEKLTLVSYYEWFLSQQLQLIGKGKSPNTIKTYRNRMNNMKAYLDHIQDPGLGPEKINIRFIREYDTYLRATKGHCNDYVMKNIQMLDKMLNLALEDESIGRNPADLFVYKYEKKKRMNFLDLDGLSKLKNTKMPSWDLEKTKDLFLFSCYTGLSYCDVKNFASKNVVKGVDGNMWISLARQKTRVNNKTILPLMAGASEIINKYGYSLPVPANKNMNESLKKIARIAGLGVALSTHAGRKTFGNVLVNDFGIDIKTVSVMMGHSSVTTTEAWYVDIKAKKIARDMFILKGVDW